MVTVPLTSKQFEIMILSVWFISTMIGCYYLFEQANWIKVGHGLPILGLPSLIGFISYLLTRLLTSDLPSKIHFKQQNDEVVN